MKAFMLGVLLTAPSIIWAQVPQNEDPKKLYEQLMIMVRDIESQTMDLENAVDIEHEGDIRAYEYAKQDISVRLENAINNLGQVKMEIASYAKRAAQPSVQGNKEALTALTSSYSERAQKSYDAALKPLVSWGDNCLKNALGRAARLCITETCVIKIRASYGELLTFGKEMNKDLNFKNLNTETKLFWDFKDPLLQHSVAETFKRMIKPNKEISAYRAILAGIVSPLSVAGTAIYEGVKGAVDIRMIRIQLDVRKVAANYKDLRKALDEVLREEVSNLTDAEVVSMRVADYENGKAEEERQVKIENLKNRLSELTKGSRCEFTVDAWKILISRAEYSRKIKLWKGEEIGAFNEAIALVEDGYCK